MAGTWIEQYMSALEARDQVEKAHQDIYESYTRLADRTAELARSQTTEVPSIEPPKSATPPSVIRRLGKPSSPAPTDNSPSLISIRQDLALAQQERNELESRLAVATSELTALKSKSKTDTKRITQLSTATTQMTVRLRDRDEELRGKAKLLEDVQDENVTLNLQLNVAEEQAKKLEQENQDLVDRWMKKMGKEAEKMNNESKFD